MEENNGDAPTARYSRELKIATMRELDAGKSVSHVAREYQLSPRRLDVWKAEWRAKGELAFPGQGTRVRRRSRMQNGWPCWNGRSDSRRWRLIF